MNPIQKMIDKLGMVLKLKSTSSFDKELQISILKGMKKDIDCAIKEIEEGN